jgi:hypothetical protein
MLANCPNRNRVLCLSKIGKQKFLPVLLSGTSEPAQDNRDLRDFFAVSAIIEKNIVSDAVFRQNSRGNGVLMAYYENTLLGEFCL